MMRRSGVRGSYVASYPLSVTRSCAVQDAPDVRASTGEVRPGGVDPAGHETGRRGSTRGKPIGRARPSGGVGIVPLVEFRGLQRWRVGAITTPRMLAKMPDHLVLALAPTPAV